ncbi:MAG TPA: glycoside hydrolase family 3 C-terminal domain-containing protein [Candidatus Dormibacteraeota bacterium]|nr:glycoside hydrolase family 3 C-terminal domain-containing protein [Candidatus Dormibacteraeota bacterium]
MLTATDRAAQLLEQLTVDERAQLSAGEDTWHLPAIPSAGIGRLKMSDGPSGVRGESLAVHRSLSFPCGTAVGSTWDVELTGRYGAALAAEAKLKGVRVLLGPTVCIPRVALAGRTFESFSEDPLLTSRLTVAYVRGVQEHGVACCIKHFACNDQEHERMTISAQVDERTLREIHLPAFEAAVREAKVWAVMSAYNRINGTFCDEHEWLLTTVLKEEWGFDGVVISDWYGTHSTVEAANAGLDIEMPGPAQHLGRKLADAVSAGEVEGAVLDDHCARVLRLAERTGLLDEAPGWGPSPWQTAAAEREEDDPQRRALARELAVSGTVLLRNESMLPLDPALRRIAVIGSNAEHLMEGGGGSSMVAALQHTALPDALGARLPGVQVSYEEGCRVELAARPLDCHLIPEGFAVEYFGNPDWSGEPVRTERRWSGFFVTFGAPPGGRPGEPFSVRARARFTPDHAGPWELSLATVGKATVHLDGRLVLDHTRPEPGETFFGRGSATTTASVDIDPGLEHELEVRYVSDLPGLGGFRIGARPLAAPGGIERAVDLARRSDAVVLVVGNHPDLETEGRDRPSLALPGDQDELVRRVLEANPRTVVVVNSGAPVAMPWADQAAAVLMVWYPGEEGAAALADILTGAAEPGGRLPITFPRRMEDVAAWRSYPGADGRVEYGEGVLVGYRQFDSDGTEPAFCFGHGLGYTTFEYGEPRLDGRGDDMTVSVTVTNAGTRRGGEVVQLYVAGGPSPVPRPEQELRAFTKVTLDAGESRDVVLRLDARAFSYWDTDVADWVAPAGRYELRVGASSRDIRQRIHVEHGQ